MRHEGSRALLNHWQELCPPRSVPDRNDLEPAVIGAHLPDVFIIGSEADGTWTYRVAGTRLTALAGRGLRDESFGQWWRAADRIDAERLLHGVVTDGKPVVGGVRGHTDDNATFDFELLLLPLRHGGRPGMRMLGGLFPGKSATQQIDLRIAELQILSLRHVRDESPVPKEPQIAAMGAPGEQRRNLWRVIDGGRATPASIFAR